MKTKSTLLVLILGITISVSAQFEKVLDGFEFTEGPAFDKAGNLYFTDIPPSKIYKYTPEGELSVYLENTGRANGLAFDKDGNLIACSGGDRQIVSYNDDGKKKVLLDNFKGKKFNSPNDLWIGPKGGIYFTDPRYGNLDGMEMDGMHVYYFHPKKGKAIKVISTMTRPNGIIGSHDGKYLYVVDEGERKFYRYTIKMPCQLKDPEVLLDEGVDGMSIDLEGNIYITAVKVVIKYNPSDGSFTRYPMDVSPTNVVWHKGVIWVTAQDGAVYRMKL